MKHRKSKSKSKERTRKIESGDLEEDREDSYYSDTQTEKNANNGFADRLWTGVVPMSIIKNYAIPKIQI